MTPVLETTLDARIEGDTVELALMVENAGDDPVRLTFSDAQRAEFVARADGSEGDDDGGENDDDGTEAWRWSRGRMFAQSVGVVALSPGEARTFEATWPDPDPGAYRVEAELAAADVDARAETTVRVPAPE